MIVLLYGHQGWIGKQFVEVVEKFDADERAVSRRERTESVIFCGEIYGRKARERPHDQRAHHERSIAARSALDVFHRATFHRAVVHLCVRYAQSDSVGTTESGGATTDETETTTAREGRSRTQTPRGLPKFTLRR